MTYQTRFEVWIVAGFLALSAAGLKAQAQIAPTTNEQLRQDTQRLLDAIAPGDVAVWQQLLDPDFMQVDENDVVRGKAALLEELKPLPPGLIGHLKIDDFRVLQRGDLAVVTHEDDESLDYYGQMILSRFRNTDTWHKTPDGWRLLASQVLAVLKDPPSLKLDAKTLCGYAGNYSLTPDIAVSIKCEQGRLIATRKGRPQREFLPELKDVFFEPGAPRTRRIFVRDSSGKVTGFVDRREARDIVWKRVS